MAVDLTNLEIVGRNIIAQTAQQAGSVSVEELGYSRVGSANGVTGSLNTVRRFMVRNFPIDQDPRDALRTHEFGVREGDSAPYEIDRLNGMVAVQLAIAEMRTPGSAVVEVLYGPPLFIPSLPEAWQIDFEGGLDTEELEIDLDGKPVGTPKYHEVALFDRGTPPPPSAQFFVNLGKQTLWLEQLVADDTRYVEPMTRTRDVHRIVLSKRIGVFDTQKYSMMVDAHNSVNDSPVDVATIYRVGSRPLRLGATGKFHWVQQSLSAEMGTAAGQNIAGILFRVSITLEYSDLGHQHKITHRATFSETGERGVVRSVATNEPVKETFKRYKTRNFTAILNAI